MLKSFDIPMFSYLRVSRTTGISNEGAPHQGQALTPRSAQALAGTAQGTEAQAPTPHAAAARPRATAGANPVQHCADSPRYNIGTIELPHEIWGEIASFSLRTDILNLRATSTALQSQADTAITTMTILAAPALRAFSDAAGFQHVDTLSIDVVDHAATDYFAQSLAVRPRLGLTLDVMHGFANLTSTLTKLSAVPLAGLVLRSPNLDDQVLHALRHFRAPITLIGRFAIHQFAALSHIPTLTELLLLSPNIDEAAAEQLSSHGALRSLALPLMPELTPQCIALLGHIVSLREWRLTEMVYEYCPLSTSVAQALAENRWLEKLVIKTYTQPVSRACFHALSTSQTLKKLEISVCEGLERLGHLETLEHLHLNGRCRGSPPINQQTAASLAKLVKLRSLVIVGAQFTPGALSTLLTVSPASTLYLKSVSLTDDHLNALIDNGSLRVLTLVDIALTQAQVATLWAHPQLVKLRIAGNRHHALPSVIAHTAQDE